MAVQVPVPHDDRLGILPVQPLQQLPQGHPLRRRAGVGGIALGVQPADVAHAKGMAVMVLAMRPDFHLVPSRLDGSVRGNHVMVATALPAQRAVIAVDVRGAEATARLGRSSARQSA